MCLFLQFWLKFCRGGDRRQPANFRRKISQPAKIRRLRIFAKSVRTAPHMTEKKVHSKFREKIFFYFQKAYIKKKCFFILFFKKKKKFAVCEISQVAIFRNLLLFSQPHFVFIIYFSSKLRFRRFWYRWKA